MNTATAYPLYNVLPEPVQSAIDTHRVVLVTSPITDVGLVNRWSSQRDLECHRVILNMRSSASRAHFDQLRRATRWKSLPQIFVDGRFIGGVEEFFDLERQDNKELQAAQEPHPYVRWLGYGGLLPFFALAVMSLFASPGLAEWATLALLGYGAVILSFVGALHWTRGLAAGDTTSAARQLTVSVLPALVGWVALLLPIPFGLVCLAVGFGLLYVYDREAWKLWPGFLSLRSHLTVGAMGSLMLTWLGGVA